MAASKNDFQLLTRFVWQAASLASEELEVKNERRLTLARACSIAKLDTCCCAANCVVVLLGTLTTGLVLLKESASDKSVRIY
jgi:hypothetical protein